MDVSIHAPARGATQLEYILVIFGKVSIHAPARGATTRKQLLNRANKFQFTRPRGARPPKMLDGTMRTRFNSRAREGRDQLANTGFRSYRCFNSRAREGRDHRRSSVSLPNRMFQFTRPRGARLWASAQLNEQQSFNSRAREGRD